MNEDGAPLDGNRQHWPGPPPGIPQSFYATPADPLVSPDYEGWWQRSIALAKRVWKPALIVHAVLVLPTLALSIPADEHFIAETERASDSLLNDSSGTIATAGYLLALGLLMGSLLIAGLMSAIATAITVQLIVLAATGQPVSLRTAVGAGLRRAHALIGWQILGGALILGSVVLCLLPVLYVGSVLMVLPVVVMLERGRGIGRCFEIFHASFGTSAARIATVAAITLIGTLALTSIGTALEIGLGGTAGLIGSIMGNGISYLFAGVVIPPLLVTAYADMRSRREPFSTAYLLPAPVKPAA